MKWHVTTHAIERLMGRVDRTITTKQAEDALYRQLDVAVKLDKLTRHGQGYYQIQAFGQPVLVIGKHDPAIRRMVAVSVLRVDEVEEEAEDTTDEVVAAYQRAQKAGTVVPFMDVSNGEMKRGVKVDELQRKIAALEAHVAVLQLEAARAEEDRERVALERRYLEKQNREAAAMLTETPTAGMMRKLARAMAHGEKMEREREEQAPDPPCRHPSAVRDRRRGALVGEMMALERFLLREATRRENPQPVKYTGRRARTKLTLAK